MGPFFACQGPQQLEEGALQTILPIGSNYHDTNGVGLGTLCDASWVHDMFMYL